MFIKYGFCVLKTITFLFHELIISKNACAGQVKFYGLCQKSIAHLFFELKIFFQYKVWNTNPTAYTVREAGH